MSKLDEIEAEFEKIYADHRSKSAKGDNYDRSLSLMAMVTVLECRDVVRQVFAKTDIKAEAERLGIEPHEPLEGLL